ncbi:sigma-E processing peptidase SpoIIGA [Bacillus shivajii]|uniref:sigma-E processing peptidase SpoIIGA n=1 Tax=Bacillus shivajii TaxID=1983719 RepID=UPI001CFAD457|nr:sigma-E processing peptidase SpoIIGA [Bacillus shivajii]UCZ51816.1 sigma-E processing peptidase SpoIIGA [Bacillus shivajii]
MQIYLDVVWLLNFLVDFMLLTLTAIVLKRDLRKFRLIVGALFASFYIFLLFTPLQDIAVNPLIKGIYSVFIIVITFGFHRFRLFIQAWLMFYFVNFAVGGGLLGVHFFLQTDMDFIQGTFATQTSGFGSPISWAFVIIGLPIMYYYSKKRFEAIETEKIRYDEVYDVKIIINDIQLHLNGFVDSGNRLEDPFTRKPVVVIDMTELGDQFPLSIQNLIKEQDLSKMEEVPSEYQSKITLLPFRTVGETNKFMWAVRPDSITLYDQGEVFQCHSILIGLSTSPLSDRNDYQCLLHPRMMQQKKKIALA